MRTFLPSFALILFAGIAMGQTLAPPTYLTDPKQITSKSNPDLQGFTLEQLYLTRAIGASAWSPDGKRVAFVSNMSGRNNIWLMSAEGGFPQQLTISDQRQTSPAWSPDGKWIAYVSDTNGDELWDLFIVSPNTGQVVNLAKTPYVAETSPAWSPDGRWIAYQTRPQESPTFEIDAINVLTKTVKHLTSGTPKQLGNYRSIWSRDGKWIAYTQEQASGRDANVFVVEVATAKATNLTPHTGEEIFRAADWSSDGKRLLITSNAENAYANVAMLDLATKKLDWLTEEKWELEAGNCSPDGKLITWAAHVDGNTDLYLYDLASHSAERLPLPNGVNALAGSESAFTRDGRHLLFYNNGPRSPNDLWVYSVADKQFYQLTRSLIAGLSSTDMVEPVLVRYSSRDGKFQISAFLYVPYNQQRDRRRPVIVYIHGGPAAQAENTFSSVIQYLVNQGYFVIAPNYRGSSGYGKEFAGTDRIDPGGGELEDVLAAADWIKGSEYIDPKKLIVMGSGYGGYLTMMALTKAPEMWAAGIADKPFANFFTLFDSVDAAAREYLLQHLGDPVKNKALWEDRSPTNFVDRIKAPLLLLAGGNDPRCPKSEAQQVYDAIKKRGGTVELKIYPNEGHGFARVENQIDAHKRIAAFLKEHVPAPGCGCSVYE